MAFISLTEIYNTPLADSTANYLAYLFETSDKTEELQYLFSVKVQLIEDITCKFMRCTILYIVTLYIPS